MKKLILLLVIPFAIGCTEDIIYQEVVEGGEVGIPGIPGETIVKVEDDSLTYFNIKHYGATGDGNTDDTKAIQEAINACIQAHGKLIIPAPDNFYKITNTLNIEPKAPDIQVWMHVEGWGNRNFQIVYMGPSGKPAVKIIGLKGGIIEGMRVRIAHGINNVQCFDIGTSLQANSTSAFSFVNCDAELGDGINNKGWRLGYIDAGGGADISQIVWNNCTAWGQEGKITPGQVGYENTGHNTLQLTWIGSGSVFCDRGVVATAGGSQFFFGYGASHNGTDFYISTSNQFSIYGGRFEVGKTFLQVTPASSHPSITISNSIISEYAPDNGRLIDFNRTGTLILDGVKIENANGRNHGANMIWLGGTTGQGNLHVRGGAFHSSDPFFTVETAGRWRLKVEDVGKLNANYESETYFANRTTTN
ncbi:MAG TPA: glycosyl hydrolase family 28-related protein [Chryseolinea sp.]|nr:glycosyl hydrolase family 28-related protein [Chryseolinea sp.]